MEVLILLILILLGIVILSMKSKLNFLEIKIDKLIKKLDSSPVADIKVEARVEAQAEVKPIAEQVAEPVHSSDFESSVEVALAQEAAQEPIVEQFAEPVVEEYDKPLSHSDFEAKLEAAVVSQESEAEEEPIVEEPACIVEKVVEKPQMAAAAVKVEKKPKNVEKYIGENLFGKIGILILVVGVGLFVKYAIDNEWLSETMRTVLGFAVGGVLLFVAERLSKKYRMFSSLLAGGAFAIFYVITAVAYHYYAIFSQPVAFGILVATTVAMIALSLIYNRRELAIFALAGGFTAPFIVSSGNGNYIVLFTYMAILCLGMVFLAIKKRWSELPIICFGATYLIMLIFTLSTSVDYIGGGMLTFATLFYLIFLLPVVYILRVKDSINWSLLSIVVSNNFLYIAFGLYFLNSMSLSLNLDGVLTLFVAAVNLGMVMWIMRYHKDRRELVYSMLGLVLSFVSLSIPLQLEGSYITLFWASEIVILLWLFVKSKLALYNYFAPVLMVLTLFSLMIDFRQMSAGSMMFINPLFATAAYTAICFIAAGIVISRHREIFDEKGILPYAPVNTIMIAIGLVIMYLSIMGQFRAHIGDDSLARSVSMIFSMLYVWLLLILCDRRFKADSVTDLRLIVMGIGFLLYLSNCFNGYNDLTFWLLTAVWSAFTSHCAYKHLKTVDLTPSAFDGFMVYLNSVVAVVWVVVVTTFANQVGIYQLSAEFSIALAILGTVQMVLGMKLHLRVLRIISVIVLSIVILKLALFDLWLMNLAGKIVVFISFGAILLSLSFLYNKLKNVLFSKDEE